MRVESQSQDSAQHPYRRGWIRKDTLLISLLAAAILVCIVVLAVHHEGREHLALLPAPILFHEMPDGSMLSLNGISFGTSHQLPFTLPSSGRALFENTTTRASNITTPTDSIVLWFSRHEQRSRRAMGFDGLSHCVAVDDHGCEIDGESPGVTAYSRNSTTSTNGWQMGQRFRPEKYDVILAHSAIRPFRHTGPTFKLRVYDTAGNIVTESSVPDPTPTHGEYEVWTPEPLPATKYDGDLTATLDALTVTKAERYSPLGKAETYQVSPSFRITRNGERAAEWTREQVTFLDAAGYAAHPWDCRLCPLESAWKARLRVFRGEQASFDDPEKWSAPTIAVAPENESVPLQLSKTIQGVNILLHAAGGSGSVAFPLQAKSKPAQHSSNGYAGDTPNGKEYHIETKHVSGTNTVTVQCELPHVAVQVSGKTDEHFGPELRVKDDQGRNVTAHVAYHGELTLWFLELPRDAKTLDLTFVVHKGRTFEFLVRPPQIEPLKPVQLDPSSPAALARRVEEIRSQIAHQERVLASQPENAGTCNNLAWAYATSPPELRDVKKAVELADRAVGLDPGNRFYINTQGVAYYRADRFADAANILERNVQGYDDGIVCFDLYFLAMAYAKTDDMAKAKETYRRAVDLNKRHETKLSNHHVTELRMFQAEAAALIAGGNAAATFDRADQSARSADWQSAAQQFADALELFPDNHWQWFRSTCLYVELGDLDGYRRHCQQLLERFGHTSDAFQAERTAKACLLVPAFQPDRELPRALAVRAVTQQPNNPWFLLARGMSDYRDDRLEDAAAWFDKASSAESKNPYCDSVVRLFQAMTQHRRGQKEQARQSLQAAVHLIETELPKIQSGDLGPGWHDWLMCQIVRREAESLLRP